LKNNFEIEKQVGHSHLPVPDLILKRKTMRTIREKSLQSSEKALDIVTKELPVLKESTNISEMPSLEYMMDVVRRVRNNQIGYITGGIIDIPDV
jgi:hypothetical protein